MADDPRGWLEALCADGIYATAGQVYASDGQRDVDHAVGHTGLGGPLGADAVAEVYCLTKPIVAAAALLACEAADVDVLEPINRLLPQAARLDDDVSVAAILAHRARLQWPSGLVWTTTPPGRRPGVADLWQLAPGAHCYSEVAGWLLLTELVRQLTGTDPAAYVNDAVTAPLGIAGEVLLDPEALAAALADGRIMVAQAGLPGPALPMWHVAQGGYLRRAGPAFGGLASARALGRFAGALMGALGGQTIAGLPAPATLERCRRISSEPRADATWLRPAGFALGYEVVAGPAGAERLQLTSGVSAGGVVLSPAEGWCAAFTLNGISLASADIAGCRDDLVRLVAPVAVR